MRALAQTQGNRAAAARALGLHEKYFLRLLKSLGIGHRQIPTVGRSDVQTRFRIPGAFQELFKF